MNKLEIIALLWTLFMAGFFTFAKWNGTNEFWQVVGKIISAFTLIYTGYKLIQYII